MARGDDRAAATPYSRTGLFPWGNTYDVPALPARTGHTSRTPCHLRPVGVPPGGPQRIACPACGRAWKVELRTSTAPPTARWTA